MAAAIARELMEEVRIEAEIIAFNRHVEAIVHEGNRIRTHFVIASFAARWKRGEPRLSDEVDAVDWIDPAAGVPSPTTPELGEILASAARIEGQTAVVKNDGRHPDVAKGRKAGRVRTIRSMTGFDPSTNPLRGIATAVRVAQFSQSS